MTTENTLPFDYFLSSQMEKIRDDMFEGKKIDGCEGCYKDEEIKSFRKEVTVFKKINEIK